MLNEVTKDRALFVTPEEQLKEYGRIRDLADETTADSLLNFIQDNIVRWHEEEYDKCTGQKCYNSRLWVPDDLEIIKL